MDKLLGWVKQIFVISILSELVIHILPDEKYEGVVRLLCGCMITAACIMPVLNIINAELVVAAADTAAAVQPVVAAAVQVQQLA